MNIKELIKQTLENTYLMSLGTYDENGPWVSDVVFVYDENFTIYWLSLPDTRHSKAIMRNPKSAASITQNTNQGEDNIGLQIEGNAFKIEGDILEIAKKHLAKRKKTEPTKEGEVFGPGQSWYCLKPTKIELIYEPLFGFEKQVLNL